jgi:vacuolar-type H+-ATPase subunit D/Vma8
MIMNREQKAQAPEFLKPEQANWKTANEILDAFKEKRGQLIKYAKTTTEDMRNHVAQMPFGYIDAYQLIVFISAHTRRHIMQIEEVKANPAFPK